ncbi:MAG: carbohydrate-binding family 9-like protein [Gemmatimonadota bacterium]
MLRLMVGFLCLTILAPTLAGQAADPPRSYRAARAVVPPVIDGSFDEPAWAAVPPSEPFVDIEGARRPAPTHETRVRMMWDDSTLYIAATVIEPDLWGTITERDAVIFHDNDFEWFIDPDGDGLRYFEFEVNALGTVWDLFLPKPYRDGGKAVDAWDIEGLRSAVRLNGTLNDPSDRDVGWTVEMAIPWTAFADSGRTTIPPTPGTTWRINFSRVQWDLDVRGGQYQKRTNSERKPLPEHNWVWSAQGEINMHAPEHWGAVTFTGN